MSARPFRALVTGAEEHQGLAVIRGLGLGGVEVVAAGTRNGCLGHRSRFATYAARYASPAADPEGFIADIIDIARRTRSTVIVPSVESTLVLLNQARARIEQVAVLAAPDAQTLEFALDKSRTLALARRLGVPAPATASGATAEDVLAAADALRYPVAIKPRGNALHASTANRVSFKCRYARDRKELARELTALGRDAGAVLVQEFARGTGRCVAAVCRDGEPLELFAYSRDRETPLSGGVSVLRRSIPLDDTLRTYVTNLLGAIRWHGVAMVEFKHDAATGAYTLMEINGRFQASTALSLDAGINLPLIAACLHAGWTLPATARYRNGVTERWLRGDLMALRTALLGEAPDAPVELPARMAVLRRFMSDFGIGAHYDEFRAGDPGPALHEIGAIGATLGIWMMDACKSLLRKGVPRSVRTRATTLHRAG